MLQGVVKCSVLPDAMCCTMKGVPQRNGGTNEGTYAEGG